MSESFVQQEAPHGPPEPGYDVFLSYNSRDGEIVRRVARELEKRGIRVWADWKMPSGSVWLLELEKVIGQVRVAAFFVGPSGLGEWHDTERQAFHIRRARIIPVLLPGASTELAGPIFLRRHSSIDFRTPGKITRKELDRLVEGIRAEATAAETAEGAAARPEPTREERSSVEPAGRPGISRRGILALALAVLLAGAFAWLVPLKPPPAAVQVPESRWQTKVPLPRPSVAVLSFDNRSPGDTGRDLDWLATALPEVVSSELGMGGAARAVDRLDVALAEADLLLPQKAEIADRDLSRLRSALGVDFVVGGSYAPVGGSSAVRLDLTLYDAMKGRRLVETHETGEVSAWLDLAHRASEKPSERTSLRRRLGVAPLTLEQLRRLRALFPATAPAARLYAQGLHRFQHFDVRGAADLLGQSAELEPHPLILAKLAQMRHALGRSSKAASAIAAAKHLVLQGGDPLPGEQRLIVELIDRTVALDRKGAAVMSEELFGEYFPDDLSYGLLAADALIDAGSAEDALLLIGELRAIPSAQKHPALSRVEADALFAQGLYPRARVSAERAVAEAQAMGAVMQESLARLLLASIFSVLGEAPKAEEQLRVARSGFEKVGDLRGVAQCIELTALVYSNLDLATAEGLYRDAIGRYQALGDQRERARALFGLSAILSLRGKAAEAQDFSQEAAALARESSSSLDEGEAEFNTASHLHLAGQLTAAQSRYEAARVIFDKTHQRDWHATTLTNLGEIEYARGNFADAADLHRQALDEHLAIKAYEGAAYDNVGLGRAKAATGNYFVARQQYEAALRAVRPAEGGPPKEPETLTEALLALAELELHTGKPGKAEQLAREAEEVADGVGQDTVRSRAQALLSRALLDQNKLDAARKASQEADRLAGKDFRAIYEAGIAAALVRAVSGDAEAALDSLRKIAADSSKAGLLVYEMESRLAEGKIEMDDGRSNPARRHLEELRTRAARLGYGQIEKRASAVLGE